MKFVLTTFSINNIQHKDTRLKQLKNETLSITVYCVSLLLGIVMLIVVIGPIMQLVMLSFFYSE